MRFGGVMVIVTALSVATSLTDSSARVNVVTSLPAGARRPDTPPSRPSAAAAARTGPTVHTPPSTLLRTTWASAASMTFRRCSVSSADGVDALASTASQCAKVKLS